MDRIGAALALLLAACSCASATPSPTGDGATVELSPPAPSRTTPPADTDTPSPPPTKTLAEGAALEEGHVVFQGMVRPTKGAYEVRGAILDNADFRKAIAGAPGADAKDPDWFLGAVVRVEAELVKNTAAPAGDQKVVEQTRSGTWFQASRIDAVKVVAPAVIIEGTLGRSKGLFELAGKLIDHEDLDWALAPNGAHSGDRVRLHGQPHTVVCRPNEQCLIEGSLPLFEVGRAERLP